LGFNNETGQLKFLMLDAFGKLWIDNFSAGVPPGAAPCLQIQAVWLLIVPRCFDPVAC
jgi:hypothetical protein